MLVCRRWRCKAWLRTSCVPGKQVGPENYSALAVVRDVFERRGWGCLGGVAGLLVILIRVMLMSLTLTLKLAIPMTASPIFIAVLLTSRKHDRYHTSSRLLMTTVCLWIRTS